MVVAAAKEAPYEDAGDAETSGAGLEWTRSRTREDDAAVGAAKEGRGPTGEGERSEFWRDRVGTADVARGGTDPGVGEASADMLCSDRLRSSVRPEVADAAAAADRCCWLRFGRSDGRLALDGVEGVIGTGDRLRFDDADAAAGGSSLCGRPLLVERKSGWDGGVAQARRPQASTPATRCRGSRRWPPSPSRAPLGRVRRRD